MLYLALGIDCVRIILHKHASFFGKTEEVDLNLGDCYNVKELKNAVSSITMKDCLFLYRQADCRGDEVVISQDVQSECLSFLGKCDINDQVQSMILCECC